MICVRSVLRFASFTAASIASVPLFTKYTQLRLPGRSEVSFSA